MQNGIIGDAQMTDLPQMVVDENELNEEKKMARYSKSSEYKRIKNHFEERIAFYKTYLPDGREITSIDMAEAGQSWVVANTIIRELQNVLDSYELAAEAVNGDSK